MRSGRDQTGVLRKALMRYATWCLFGCGGVVAPAEGPPSAPLGITAIPIPIGMVTTVAGSGIRGYRDDTLDVAQFDAPVDVAVGGDGRLLVADYFAYAVRMVTSTRVTTLAGGQQGSADGVGSAARFDVPRGIVLDRAGNAYVADAPNCAVRKVSSAGVVTTLITPGICPEGIGIDPQDHLFVNDDNGAQVWRVGPSGGVTVLAGSVKPGYADGHGLSASFSRPGGIGCDADGNVYVGDVGDNRIRKVTPIGDVTTLAGSGQVGFADGAGVQAKFNGPGNIDVDANGNLYVADVFNNSIRRVSPEGVVTTLAGTGKPGYQDGPGSVAMFTTPGGVGLDAAGDVFVADNNNRIRKVAAAGTGSLVVKWTAVSAKPPVTDYTVAATATGRPSKSCSTADTTCTVKGLTSGVSYSVTVTASNTRGAGQPSAPVLATPN